MRERTEPAPARARRQGRQKACCQAQHDEMRQQQRECCQSMDEAAHADRVREYRRKNHEAYLAYQREYRARNKDRFAEYNRRYRAAAKEKRGTQREEGRQELLIASGGPKEPRTYYERNRQEICKRRIGEDCFRAMEKVKKACPERVAQYMEQWPFDAYADRRIKSQLQRWHICPHHHLYDDCYDAGMLAYLYSIHRCAMMEYQHVAQYIAKMVRIFVICALNVGRDAENLCRRPDLRLCRLDHNVFDA